MTFTMRELDSSTWDAFAELVERNNGIFGGCWCIGYHPECGQKGISHRAVKEDRVRTGRAHAALVFDLEGALDQIARRGGGPVEAISEVTAGREAQGRFLFSATVEFFDQYGFTPRPPGRQACMDHEQGGRSGAAIEPSESLRQI